MEHKHKVVTVPVKGMNCASCARNIENIFNKYKGVENAEVNFATEKAKIKYDDSIISLQDLSNKIQPLGYSLHTEHETGTHIMADGTVMTADEHAAHLGLNQTKEEKLAELKKLRNKILFALPITFIVFVLMLWEIFSNYYSFIPKLQIPMDLFQKVLFVLSAVFLFWIGQIFIKGVITFAAHFVANMDTLVGVGTLTAFLYSSFIVLFPEQAQSLKLPENTYFDVTIVVIGFITLGKYLEARSKLRTGEAIEKLINLQSKTAIVEREGSEVEISIADVKVGDIVIVKPGSKIPVDGEIISGKTSIDESMITGEPIPTDKNLGDKVIGGTINKQGAIKFKALKVGSETMLSNIIRLVEDAQGSRAPIQKLADQISGVFVPIVLVIALLTLILWLTLGQLFYSFDTSLSLALMSFVGILVIACPCALGLATPTAIIVGVGKGAMNGILIKNAESLEKLYKIDTVIFDKTGTLTKGKPELSDILLKDNKTESESLQILASLEKNSEHPIAMAILEKAKAESLEFKTVESFESIEGEGINGVIDGVKYFAGNIHLIKRMQIDFDINEVTSFTERGKTPVFLFTEKSLVAFFTVEDLIKDQSIETVSKLHKLGIKVAMLTGDDANTAKYIASKLNIDDYFSEVLPQDKSIKIKELQDQGRNVAMVGDGINDAPALAQSNVGIAMSTGTDIAIEAADITILSGDISRIVQAINLSKSTIRTVKQNLFWAFVYNIIGIPVASGILYPIWGIILNPGIAGLAMAFSSVSVVLNSLRLKSLKI